MIRRLLCKIFGHREVFTPHEGASTNLTGVTYCTRCERIIALTVINKGW